jgi:predicted nucleotidyltransferase
MERQTIIDGLHQKLEASNEVLAAWIAGSAAFGRVDEWSDIDLSVLVEEGFVDGGFSLIEEALSEIEFIHPMPSNPAWPGMQQKFYRLKGAGEFLLVDAEIITRSSPELFLDTSRHGKAIILFDKEGLAKEPPFDAEGLRKKLKERLAVLKTQFPIFQMLPKKELRRGNIVEALEFYRNYTLRPLVEVLRMKHDPKRYDFHIRYLRYDLPDEARILLENLYFVAEPSEIEEKQKQAEALFWETFKTIDPDAIVF